MGERLPVVSLRELLDSTRRPVPTRSLAAQLGLQSSSNSQPVAPPSVDDAPPATAAPQKPPKRSLRQILSGSSSSQVSEPEERDPDALVAEALTRIATQNVAAFKDAIADKEAVAIREVVADKRVNDTSDQAESEKEEEHDIYFLPPKTKRRRTIRETARFNARVERALNQRMYLIDRQVVTPLEKEEFKVLGSTGNVYKVTVEQSPSCSCPDSRKDNRCKHILFVLIRVLRLPEDSPLLWETFFQHDELEDMLSQAPPQTLLSVLASERVRDAYEALVSGKGAKVERKSLDCECPICMEDMAESPVELVAYCAVCGNNIHKDCLTRWLSQSVGRTCVYCRQPWTDGGSPLAAAGEANTNEGYVNLSHEADMSRERHYYSRTRRWGYN